MTHGPWAGRESIEKYLETLLDVLSFFPSIFLKFYSTQRLGARGFIRRPESRSLRSDQLPPSSSLQPRGPVRPDLLKSEYAHGLCPMGSRATRQRAVGLTGWQECTSNFGHWCCFRFRCARFFWGEAEAVLVLYIFSLRLSFVCSLACWDGLFRRVCRRDDSDDARSTQRA